MSQMIIKRSLMLIVLCLSVTVIVGCGSPNSNSLVNPETGQHSVSWMTGSPIVHGATAENGLAAAGFGFAACQGCHGNDFMGGIAKVSCYTGTANGCHNGPGQNHPAPGWVVPLSAASTLPFHKTEAAANVAFCAKCHGADYLGGASGIACNSCHLDGPTSIHGMGDSAGNTGNIITDHPLYIEAHGGVGQGTAKCANGDCHGDPFNTTDVHDGLSGPNCNTCHPCNATHCGP